MRICLIYFLLCGCLLFSLPLEGGETGDARFYWSVELKKDNRSMDGTGLILAVGQKNYPAEKTFRGYAAVFSYSSKTGKFTPVAEDLFDVEYEGKRLPGRCRTAEAVWNADKKQWNIYSVGRGGTDETGTGFLRHWIFDGKNLVPGQTLVFKQNKGVYTHGYPMAVADVTGDGKTDIVYGGFSGKDEVDYADVRVFERDAEGALKRSPIDLFKGLSIPFRVNAMVSGDIDGDGKTDIIIAGRSKKGKFDRAVFAWWSAGNIYYHTIETGTHCWLRTLLISDIDGDGKPELVTGGRIDAGKTFFALLQVWNIKAGKALYRGGYHFTLDGSTRLRTLAPGIPNSKGTFIAAGRTQVMRKKKNKPKWEGFVETFKLTKRNRLLPKGKLQFLSLGKETRIRHLLLLSDGKYLATGFTMDKNKNSAAFLSIVK